MTLTADLFLVIDEPSDPVVDCRVELVVPNSNGGGNTFGFGYLVPRDSLPAGYTWQHLADACTVLLDTPCITVTVFQPAP